MKNWIRCWESVSSFVYDWIFWVEKRRHHTIIVLKQGMWGAHWILPCSCCHWDKSNEMFGLSGKHICEGEKLVLLETSWIVPGSGSCSWQLISHWRSLSELFVLQDVEKSCKWSQINTDNIGCDGGAFSSSLCVWILQTSFHKKMSVPWKTGTLQVIYF